MGSPTDWKAAAAVAASERGMGSAVIGVREDLGAPLTERAPDPRRAVEAALARCRSGERAAVLLVAPELPQALLAVEDARRQAHGGASESMCGLVVHAFGGPSEVHHALSAGMMVLSTWTGQDAIDMALAGRRAAEDSRIPVLHLCDVARESVEAGDVPGDAMSRSFVGERGVLGAPSSVEATGAPDSAGSAGSATQRAPFALGSAMRDLSERTGRSLAPLHRFDTLDAEEVIVTFGAAVPAALAVCRDQRSRARKVGLVALGSLRPFFGPELVKATSRARTIAVLEPTPAGLCPSGRIAAELKAAFADALTWAAGYPGIGKIPNVISVSLSELASPGAGQLALVLDEMDRGERARRLLSL